MSTALSLNLPWAISPSASEIAVEWTDHNECIVKCDAFYGLHCLGAQYKRVAITFQRCVAISLQVHTDDSGVMGLTRYDWSRVRIPRIASEQELTSWLEQFSNDWQQNGICPNSNFFKIEESVWSASVDAVFNHYIVEGSDSYVELLARGFTWIELEDIEAG